MSQQPNMSFTISQKQEGKIILHALAENNLQIRMHNAEEQINLIKQQEVQMKQQAVPQYVEQNIKQEKFNQVEHIKNVQMFKNISLQNQIYHFSEQYKSRLILLTNQNTTATNPEKDLPRQLVLVEGTVLKKGSSIRFKIQSIGFGPWVGLGIRNLIATNQYRFENYAKIGHGCFIVGRLGGTYSHSHKEHNWGQTSFEFAEGNVICVETNEDELWFRNETNECEFKMKIRLTEEEWQQACFCVQLIAKGDSVSILNK